MTERMNLADISLAAVRYDTQSGLVPVVVQDDTTKDVLMLAYANREALKRTLASGHAWFWSRSRNAYWRKGATSGNVFHVTDVCLDCDADTVLYLVKPAGPACHTGETSCFYRRLTHQENGHTGMEIHDNARLPAATAFPANKSSTTVSINKDIADWQSVGILSELWKTIDHRFLVQPEGSYTTYLFTHGVEKIGKKVGEEAVEVALAALRAELGGDSQPVITESADLLYHLLVLWRAVGLSPEDVLRVLAERM